MHRTKIQFIRQSMKSKEIPSKRTKIMEKTARENNMILPDNNGLTKEQMKGIRDKGFIFLISDSNRRKIRTYKNMSAYLDANNRKPINARGVKTRLAVKHLIETFKEVSVKASINKIGKIMREKFTYKVPTYKIITHQLV